MKKTCSLDSQQPKRGGNLWRMLSLAVLTLACLGFNGCATTSSTQTAYNEPLPGPAYYQSDDNPFHAD